MTAPDTRVNALERLVFFSDAIYSIAITLLALDIRIPKMDERMLPALLLDLAPAIAIYVLTFLVIGLFWVSHHRMFDMIVRFDYALVWLNMFVLLVVAFLPVPNAVFARYSHSPYAALFYAGTLSLAAMANLLLWWYATRHHRHIRLDAPPHDVRLIFRRHATTLVVQLAAMLLAFANTAFAFALMILYGLSSIATVILETRHHRGTA